VGSDGKVSQVRSVEERYGEKLFAQLMQARALGLAVRISPAEICPKGTPKAQAWEAIVKSVGEQVRQATKTLPPR
jgi:hypothetical protein